MPPQVDPQGQSEPSGAQCFSSDSALCAQGPAPLPELWGGPGPVVLSTALGQAGVGGKCLAGAGAVALLWLAALGSSRQWANIQADFSVHWDIGDSLPMLQRDKELLLCSFCRNSILPLFSLFSGKEPTDLSTTFGLPEQPISLRRPAGRTAELSCSSWPAGAPCQRRQVSPGRVAIKAGVCPSRPVVYWGR